MLRNNERGQAIIEYVLLLFAAIVIIGIFGRGMVKIRNYLMGQIICEVAAPCPGCPPGEEIKDQVRKISPANTGCKY